MNEAPQIPDAQGHLLVPASTKLHGVMVPVLEFPGDSSFLTVNFLFIELA